MNQKSCSRLVVLLFTAGLLLVMCGCDFTQYLAHYANVAGWTTRIKIQNGHSAPVDTDITVYDDAGTLQATAHVTVSAGGFFSSPIQSIPFDNPIPVTGSVKIVTHELAMELATISKVSCIAVFEYEGGPCMAGLQSFTSPQKAVHFPWFENSGTMHTGIAILNVEAWPITVFLRAAEPDGTHHESDTVTLLPMQRIIQYPADLFPAGLPEDTVLSVYGSGRVAGFILMHTPTFSKAEAVNGVPDIPIRPELASAPVDTDIDLTPILKGASSPRGAPGNPAAAYTPQPRQLLFSPDGARMYILIDTHLYEYDRHARTRTYSFDVAATCIALSPDGKRLYVGTASTIYAYDTDGHRRATVALTTPVVAISASNDGYFLGYVENTHLHILELGGDYLYTFTGGTLFSDCLFTQDSAYLLGIDYTTHLLYMVSLPDLKSGKAPPPVPPSVNVQNNPNTLLQDPASGKIYIGHDYHVVSRWNYPQFTAAGTSLTVGGEVLQMSFSPDGRYLYIPGIAGDQKLWVYDTKLSAFKTTAYNIAADVQVIQSSPEGDQVFFVENSIPNRVMYIY